MRSDSTAPHSLPHPKIGSAVICAGFRVYTPLFTTAFTLVILPSTKLTCITNLRPAPVAPDTSHDPLLEPWSVVPPVPPESSVKLATSVARRSEERRVGKECR